MPKIDPSVVSNGKSNDLNHSVNPKKTTDLRSEDMADDSKEQVSFLREMVLINDPRNHVVLIQGALYPCEKNLEVLHLKDNHQNSPSENEGQCLNLFRLEKRFCFGA